MNQKLKSSMEREIMRTTMDPLLLRLSSDYIDDADLSEKLKELYQVYPNLVKRHMI